MLISIINQALQIVEQTVFHSSQNSCENEMQLVSVYCSEF